MRWYPDTCGCVVDEDDSVTPKKLVRVVTKCPVHAGLTDTELYDVIYASPSGENRRKNELQAWLLAQTDYGEDRADPGGGGLVRAFKAGIGMTWAFEGTGNARTLTIALSGISMTGPRRNALTGFINASAHAGKVRII